MGRWAGFERVPSAVKYVCSSYISPCFKNTNHILYSTTLREICSFFSQPSLCSSVLVCVLYLTEYFFHACCWGRNKILSLFQVRHSTVFSCALFLVMPFFLSPFTSHFNICCSSKVLLLVPIFCINSPYCGPSSENVLSSFPCLRSFNGKCGVQLHSVVPFVWATCSKGLDLK